MSADHEWHVAINRFHHPDVGTHPEWCHWMYEAKTAMNEQQRLTRLFLAERTGKLRVIHQQCSRQPEEPLADNHLTCCLGVECRKCPQLLALDSAKMTPEEIDTAKSWTCVAHILSKGGDISGEGYVLDESDKEFWQRTYANLAADPPDEP